MKILKEYLEIVKYMLPLIPLITLILGIVLFILMLTFVLRDCSSTLHKAIPKTIQDIGGCDKYGECGVMFTDGTTGKVYYPVKSTTTNKYRNMHERY